jgi:hypothetical protein
MDLCPQLNMTHVLCSHHFMSKIKAVGGLGEDKKRIEKKWIQLLTKNFPSENDWLTLFNQVFQQFDVENSSHANAISFMNGKSQPIFPVASKQ